MMSPFISRLSRHCLSKPAALRNLGGARFLSKTPLCYIVGAEHCGSTSEDGDTGKLVICNFSATPCGTRFYKKGRGPGSIFFKIDQPLGIVPAGCGHEILEKTVPMDLTKENGIIGASHGWVATWKDGVIRLQDDLNPTASDTDPKRISLPPLVTLPHCQTQLVTNVAMSSSSPEDEDCIVAVKFVGSQLSLCRPARKENSDWVNIRIEDPGFSSSRVMYSKKDNMFTMLGSGGLHKGSWDLEKKHVSHNLRFISDPKLSQTDWELLNSCRRQEFLVESPTGETFMVKWYTCCYWNTEMEHTVRFLVFKIIENEIAICTKDIGDLCIFVSKKGEPFCLKASLYGLSPNFIYYLGRDDFGKFNLHNDETNGRGGISLYPSPYFIPPQS